MFLSLPFGNANAFENWKLGKERLHFLSAECRACWVQIMKPTFRNEQFNGAMGIPGWS